MMDESETNERYGKWQTVAIWCFASVLVLILYFFAYPVVVIKMVDGDYLNDIPDWLDTAMEWSVIPIDWIYENIQWYRILIDGWVGRK
ncbi:hypothetical protein OAK81_02650 [Verrucomicrobiales bacterium]|nr:hypothetical protein [Verrucomicrobiales bacterium]